MKSDDIIDAVGKIDDVHIENVKKIREKRKKQKNLWIKVTAIAACLCLAVTGILYGFDFESKKPLKAGAYVIEEPVYPEMPEYPNAEYEMEDEELSAVVDKWYDSRAEKLKLLKGYENCLDDFIKKTAKVFMTNEQMKNENTVFSPINLFMALSVLAETTGGESRKQILDIIGTDSVEELRTQANKIWNLLYCDDGASKIVLSNSLWLDDNIKYKKNAMKLLAENYYASSFHGEMGSEDYNAEFQRWLSQQTGGILDEYASNEKFSENTVFSIASTVFFSAKWLDEFDPQNNTQDIFHSLENDKTVEFMNEEMSGGFYQGEKFSATSKQMVGGTGELSMNFLLPNENVSVYELLENEEALEYILGNISQEEKDYLHINFSVPKFDISSEIDLREGMEELGIKDIFDSESSDFSPILDDKGIYVDKADHAARITIDEKGCVAAAFSAFDLYGTGMVIKTVDFILNRPFIVVINDVKGFPLFIGIVNNI